MSTGVQAGSISKGIAAVVVLAAVGCQRGPQKAPVIGEAFVGPATLKIRGDIPLESPPVATVKHGERLEILRRRRLFLRVRTPNGAEGWTDDRQLLGSADMAALKELSGRAAHMPPQGQAFSFTELNLHTQPNAHSPSFLQIKANEKVQVLTHLRMARTDMPRQPLIPPAPKKARTSLKKSAPKPPRYPIPPIPKPPGPPGDWLNLSKTDVDQEPPPEAPEEKPVATDDWSLVRAASGPSGWVLTRRLVMAIPDEVAQYAEGKRIVSYFALDAVMDGDQKKPTWLWTTSLAGPQPYDFESFRVFVWSLRHHRYETAYIERKVKGESPVLVGEVEYSSAKSKSGTAKYPGFSVCLENADGQRVRREYALLGNLVRYAGERACEAPPPPLVALQTAPGAGGPPAEASPPAPSESFGQRFKKRWRALTKGLFGG